jgi:uracil-DNA glycosylase
MKVATILGQAPAKNMKSRRAFDGAAGERLASIAGMTLEELRQRFWLRNVLDEYPGESWATRGKGDAFPMALARERAARMRFLTPIVVFCGTDTAGAFGCRAPFLEWFIFRRTRQGVVIPHPSGINRYYNRSENKQKVRDILASILQTNL